MHAAPFPRSWMLDRFYAVSGVTLLVILFSGIISWQRPVSAIAGIAGVSDIVQLATGRISAPPHPRYAEVHLQPGDQIRTYAGMTWTAAQRHNMHEVPPYPVGTTLALTIQRGDRTIPMELTLHPPSVYERMMLMRYTVSALVIWGATTFLLLISIRTLRPFAAPTAQAGGPPDMSGVSRWIVLWYGVALVWSLEGLKYPVAVLLANALTPLCVAGLLLCLWPYPFVPSAQQPRRGLITILTIGSLAALGLLWTAYQTPLTTLDWRYCGTLVRPQDSMWWWWNGTILLGISLALVQLFLVAYAHALQRGLARLTPWMGPWCRRRLPRRTDQLALLATHAPPSLRSIAQIQLTIAFLYVVLDMIPRWLGGVGAGYSVLVAAIPMSYLLVYSDMRIQVLGVQLVRWGLLLVFLIQVPRLWHLTTTAQLPAQAMIVDQVTLALVAGASVGSGGLLLVLQWWYQRHQRQTLSIQLDQVITQGTPEALWQYLVNQMGPSVDVTAWLWLERHLDATWHIVRHTAAANPRWITDPHVQRYLRSSPPLRQQQPTMVTTGTLLTLLLLPMGYHTPMQQVIIAANPRAVHASARLVRDWPLYQQVFQALQVMGHRELQRRLAAEQAAVAQRRQRAQVYRQLARVQRQQMYTSQTQMSAMLHDRALHWLVELTQTLQQIQHDPHLSADRQRHIAAATQQCQAINTEIRAVIRALRPRGVGTRCVSILEEIISSWARQHRALRFRLTMDEDDPPLTESQRNALFLVVNQAVENAIQHAQPTVLHLQVTQDQHSVTITVEDDGCGFDVSTARSRSDALGLWLMEDVTEELGGQLVITTCPGTGTHVMLTIPVQRDE